MSRQFDDTTLGSIELFCLAAELGGFTAAATAAGVTPAAVSRSISRLEERMRVRLFVRTTRHIHLTDAGQLYFEHCRHALGELLEAERAISRQQLLPTGVLRISAPTTYAHFRLLPLVPAFRAQHPDVQVDVHVGNRNVDLAEEGFDLAIRVRAMADSGLVARHLEDAPLVTVASPDYLARRGAPKSIEDLARHDCVQFDLPSSGRPISWLFRDSGHNVDALTRGGYTIAEDVLGGVTLARHGAGIFQTYRFVVENDLREGSLVEVLTDFSGRSRPFKLLYPPHRHLPLRVRSFIDFLMHALA